MHAHNLWTATCFAAILLINLGRGASAENWPCFRGPTGQGYTTEENLPLTWGKDGENVAWKSPLVGQGHASPIVWGERVFVCTAEWDPSVREREKVIPAHHVLCYAAGNGKLLWDTAIPPGPWLRTDFRSGPGGGYACPTPATDGQRVYCVFGSSVMAAVDFQGRIAWRKEIVPYTFDVTPGSSPVLYGDTVIYLCAMAKPSDSKLVAFDKRTGAVKWETKMPRTGFGHSTPLVIRPGGKPQLIVAASAMQTADEALQSFNPENGERIWWCRGSGDAASAAYGAGIVYCDSGRGAPGVAVDPTGRGDVSQTHVRWTSKPMPEGIASPVIVDGRVYRLHSPAILKCWEAASGQQVYVERLANLSTTWASPVVDPKGRIFFASAGKSCVVQAGSEFKLLAANDLDDPNHASPAIAAGSMFLVGTKNIYCVRAGAKK